VIGRRQLAVASPISLSALVHAFVESTRADTAGARAHRLVADTFHVGGAALTDSGTSALVLALRLAAPNGATVGYPGYACVDLAAAAQFAGVRVRLYDIDPTTLSPDQASVKRMLDRGVDAIVVAHLFGYAADVHSVRELAAERGVVVIEDAAQGAGGTWNGRRLGGLGDLGVVSFGRGKGLCAGGGGALLGQGDRWAKIVEELELHSGGRGLGGIVKTGVQWALGRPSVYALPAMLPFLHLGEMVYHEAGEPVGMPVSASSLVPSAFRLEESDLETRRCTARMLDDAAARAPKLARIAPIAASLPGYLRYAVRDVGGTHRIDPKLGVVQPYPRTLAEQPELRSALVSGEPATPGAAELRRSLFTLPTHRFVRSGDLAALARWMN
jgi:perosamine synthetase